MPTSSPTRANRGDCPIKTSAPPKQPSACGLSPADSGGPTLSPLRPAALVAALLLAATASAQVGPASDRAGILPLANADIAHGDDHRLAELICSQLGHEAAIDNTNSVHVSFGSGAPHTLIVAGLDHPGYVVSGFTDEGYLRVQSATDLRLDRYFLGQPVTVAGRPGVVVAPSVHFKSDRGYSRGAEQLFIDVGAESREEAQATFRILDRVHLSARPYADGRGVYGPWISSRAGAAMLLSLAQALKEDPPPHRVSLAFVSGQYSNNPGLLRALRSVDPDRVVMIRPGGPETPTVQAVQGWDSALRDELSQANSGVERGASARISFGPFGPQDPWPRPEQSVAVTLGVANAGTPIEAVSWDDLQRIEALLSPLAGLPPDLPWARLGMLNGSFLPPPEPPKDTVDRLRRLAYAHGVSGDESAVRDLVRSYLPAWAQEQSSVDEKGNLVVRVGDEGPPQALFIAHLDEIGFTVTRAAADGRLTLRSEGGLSEDLFTSRVLRSPKGKALFVRSGMAQAAPGAFEEGDTLTPEKLFVLLGEHRISARGLDDRIGCLVLLAAVRALSKNPEGAPVWVVFSVEEETGLHGAAHIAQSTSPKRVYPIDSFVTSDSPLEPKRIAYAPLGAGAVLRAVDHSGATPRQAVDRVLQLARDNTIPLQVGVTAGGNDGSTFTASGSVNIPLAFPLRYSHTAVEVADLRDVRALIALVQALLDQELAAHD